MKNAINYYYNLNPDKINQIFDYYYFYVDNELYCFVIYDRNNNIKDIYYFNRELINMGIMVNEIINNRNDTIITIINGIPYVLMKVFININKEIKLSEINYLANVKFSYIKSLMRDNWANLWIRRIDYLEYYHEQNYKKFTLLNEGFNYFIGMAENAISYLNNIINNYGPKEVDIGVISHDYFGYDDSIYSLYNPMNIIIDHKARDVAEYIKISFFRDNYDIFEELDTYFKYNYYSFFGISLILARVMYPSFYFRMYDDVISNRVNERDVLKITSRIDEYEEYLKDIFNYFHKYYNVFDIDWIKKRGVNPH